MSDAAVSPSHYTRGGFQLWDVLDAWELDRWSTQAVQYVFRAPYKGHEVEDLKKAVRFLEHRIEQLEATPRPVTLDDVAGAIRDLQNRKVDCGRRIGGIPVNVKLAEAISCCVDPQSAAQSTRVALGLHEVDALPELTMPENVELLCRRQHSVLAQLLVDAAWRAKLEFAPAVDDAKS